MGHLWYPSLFFDMKLAFKVLQKCLQVLQITPQMVLKGSQSARNIKCAPKLLKYIESVRNIINNTKRIPKSNKYQIRSEVDVIELNEKTY